MRLYLDDDTVKRAFVAQLRQAGHDVQIPREVGLMGEADAVHLLHAIQEDRIFFSYNADDFEELHDLVTLSGGTHPGILVVRKDQDRRDMSLAPIVAAIARVMAAQATIVNSFIILNQWR